MGKNYNLKLRTLKLRNKIEIQFNTKITLIMNEMGLRKTRGIVHYIWDFIKIHQFLVLVPQNHQRQSNHSHLVWYMFYT